MFSHQRGRRRVGDGGNAGAGDPTEEPLVHEEGADSYPQNRPKVQQEHRRGIYPQISKNP